MPSVTIAPFEIIGDPEHAAAVRLLHQRHAQYRVPAHRLIYVRDAVLVGPHLLCVVGRELVMESFRGQRSFQRTPYLRRQEDGGYEIDASASGLAIEGDVVAVGGKAVTGYFHWIVEILPRLLNVKTMRPLRKVPVVMRPAPLPFQQETLDLLRVRPRFVEENAIRVDGAWLPTHMVLSSGNAQISPEAVAGCRRFAAEWLGLIPSRTRRRLYLSRSDARKRRVSNEAALVKLLDRYGFEVVRSSEHSLRAQIQMFLDAEYVIGPHGGALTSIAFCEPGARILELHHQSTEDISPFWRLSSLGALDYRLMLCRPVESAGVAHDADMDVDLDVLEHRLRSELGA